MDSTKSNVVKSKSSNSNILTKTERGAHKKSRSNAEFHQEPHVFKKRGVYVEKKTTKLSINAQEPDNAQQKEPDALLLAPVKPPRRPKRGQKPFLDSVLTILSQCTTSTQYPDPNEAIHEFTIKTGCADRYIERKKHRRAVIKANARMVEEGTQQDNAIVTKKKKKYISKVLTDEMLRLNDRVTVLQEKKQINLTPSNYSAMSSVEVGEAKKWLDLPLGKDNATEESPIRKLLNENIYSNLVEKKAKNVVEHTRLENKKVLNNVEPLTQVSEDRQRDARGMYNFFIDLLETTFSIYNVKADYNATTTPSEFDSRTVLEIDEEVANKLIFTKETIEEPEPIPDLTQNAYKIKYYSILDDLPAVPNNKQQPKSGLSASSRRTQRTTKLNSKSFPYAKQYKTESPRNKKTVPPKRTRNKKDKKQALFDSLKEQLQMDVDAYEEPQNIYQALTIIAKNNKKNKKATHFYQTPRDNDHNDDECVFKRQKFFTEGTKKRKRTTKPANFDHNFMKSLSNSTTARKFKVNTPIKVKFSDTTNYSRNDITTTDYESDDESYHSIEVEGYDYEEQRKTAKDNEVVIADMRLIFSNTDLKSKNIVKEYLDCQSVDPFSDCEYTNREDLTFSTSDSSYMT